MEGYGWQMHDGDSFGHQVVRDQKMNVDLDMYYLKQNETEWAARVTGKERLQWDKRVSLLFYFGLDGGGRIEQKVRA